MPGYTMDFIKEQYDIVSSGQANSTSLHCLTKDLNIDSLLNWINRVKPTELNMIPLGWISSREKVHVSITKKHDGLAISIE